MNTNNTNQNANDLGRGSNANHSYLKCKHWSFRFADARNRLEKLMKRKEEVLEGIGEIPSPFKKVISCTAISVGIGLAVIEASNISHTLSAATGLGTALCTIVGTLFSCIGMLAGELVSNVKRDEFTGKRKFTGQQALGLLLIVIYLGGQYYIAHRAEMGAGDMSDTVHTMTIFISGIAIIEVLFGFLFLKTAIQVASVLSINIRLRLIIRRMNTTSRYTEELFQRHLFEVQTYNEANGTNVPQGDEVITIREAREYYNTGGFANM